MLAFDVAVFALTISRIAAIGPKWRGTLFTLFLRDGEHGTFSSCYFYSSLFRNPQGLSISCMSYEHISDHLRFD